MTLTPEQLEQRRGLLTASDAAAVLGLSPWRTPHDVWLDKMGQREPWRGNFKTRRGHAIEPLLLEWLGERKAPLVVVPAGDTTLTHPILGWLGATPDAMVYADAERSALVGVGEAKSTGLVEHWTTHDGEPMVAEYYHPQVVVQMAVAQAPRAFVVAEILTERGPESEPWVLEVERDLELEAMVLEELDDFRRRYVETRTPPPLDGASYRTVSSVFRRVQRAELVPASPGAHELAQAYMAARADVAAATERLERAKADLCALIGDAEGVDGGAWRATWKERPASVVPSFERKAYRHFDLRAVSARAAKKG